MKWFIKVVFWSMLGALLGKLDVSVTDISFWIIVLPTNFAIGTLVDKVYEEKE